MSPSVAHSEWRTSETSTIGALRLPRLGDERLARLAARGSARAFAAVYERYHQPLYRYCRSILRDDTDAQDALQSTFTRALSALKRDQRSAPLRPWLFRIAHNESISVLRRRRGACGPDPLDDGSMPLVPSAEHEAGERARLEALMGDLGALPERARNALVMRELSGLSHEDIAIALGISEGAAKQAIFEARRGLHECAEGRAMPCVEVCRAISDGDRRVLRGRRVRAHLRDCDSCAAFASAIETRQAELRAVVPLLPAAASAAVLARVMHGGAVAGGLAGSGAGGAGGASGAAVAGPAGKTAGVAIAGKSFAAASLLATAAVSVGGVAAVVRLSHEGRPAVAFGSDGRAAVALGAVHPASGTVAVPVTASVRAALGTASATRGTVAPHRRAIHARSARPSRGRSTNSHGQPGSFTRGQPASSSIQGQLGPVSHGRSGSPSHGKSASAPGHSASSSSHGKSASAPGHSASSSSHGKSASAPGHSASSSHGKSASAPGHSPSASPGSSAASSGNGHVDDASNGHGGGKQTAPGQVKKTVAATAQSATATTDATQGLGVAKKVGTDVSVQPALTGGKGNK